MIDLGIMASTPKRGANGLSYSDEILSDSPFFYFPLSDSSAPIEQLGSSTAITSAYTTYPTFGTGPSLGDGAASAYFPNDISVGIKHDNGNPPIGKFTVSALIRPLTVDVGSILNIFATNPNGTIFNLYEGYLHVWSENPSWPNSIYGTTKLVAGNTYHVAFTCTVGSSGTNYMYLNGALEHTDSWGTMQKARSYIGVRPVSGYERPFYGNIAGVAQFYQELPQSRILAQAQAAGLA